MERRRGETSDPLNTGLIRSALQLWHDIDALGKHPLVTLPIVEQQREQEGYPDSVFGRGMALHDVLITAINKLKPTSGIPNREQKTWRWWRILYGRYIEGETIDTLSEEFSVVRNRLYHLDGQAIKALTDKLRQLNYNRHGFSVGSTVFQLRPPVSDFVGRTFEQDQLVSTLTSHQQDNSTVKIACIVGMPGSGKTELAHVVAYKLSASFADGHILLSLHGTSSTPLTAEQALQGIIRAIKPRAELPTDLVALQGIYYSLLRQKNVLILADDAYDVSQVAPLLPPLGSALIVTSRNRFVLPGMQILDLDVLPPDDAIHLLLTICPRIGPYATSLAERCAYLPLTLRLAASFLATYIDRTPHEYLIALNHEQLMSLKDGNKSIVQTLQVSIQQLERDKLEPAFWQALAVCPTSFDLSVAASVGAQNEAQAQNLLSELVRRSLVNFDTVTSTYRLHDLLRAYALTALEQPIFVPHGYTTNNWGDVQTRHANHFLTVGEQLDKLYKKGHAHVVEALRQFDAQWPHFEAAWEWMSCQTSENAVTFVSKFPSVLIYLLYSRLSPRQLVPFFEKAVIAARQLGDQRVVGVHLGNLGLAYTNLGEYRLALTCHLEALAIDQEIGDHSGEADDIGSIGLAYNHLKEWHSAIKYHRRYLKMTRTHNNQIGQAIALTNLGEACVGMNKPRQGIICARRALTLFTECGLLTGVAAAWITIGTAYVSCRDLEAAFNAYEQAYTVAQGLGDQRELSVIAWHWALACEQNGQYERAVELMTITVDYERGIGHAAADEHAAHLMSLRQAIGIID